MLLSPTKDSGGINALLLISLKGDVTTFQALGAVRVTRSATCLHDEVLETNKDMEMGIVWWLLKKNFFDRIWCLSQSACFSLRLPIP